MATKHAKTGVLAELEEEVVRPDENRAPAPRRRPDDIEEGGGSDSVHVSINISGMTCTGCASKGVNVLNRIAGVSRPQINFINSIGEFDVDSKMTLCEAIFQFERETGFRCSRVMRNFQMLDVMMSSSEARQLEDKMPAGIDSVVKIDKRRCSIIYDPTLIGSRTVLGLVPSGTLVPPRDDSTLASGKKKVHQMGWSTILAAAFTIPVVVLAWADISTPYSTRSIVSLILATCVQAIAIPNFYVGALKSAIFNKVIEMDMLVVVSITTAYGYSVIAFALTHRGYVLEQGSSSKQALCSLLLFSLAGLYLSSQE